jgi:CrcB protein
MQTILAISLGAVFGANARYWLTAWAEARWGGVSLWGANFPWGTMMINLTGSLLLGMLVALAAEKFPLDNRIRALLITGFLGSYTTFSTYTMESIRLMVDGHWLPGFVNLIGSALFGGIMAAIGLVVGMAAAA